MQTKTGNLILKKNRADFKHLQSEQETWRPLTVAKSICDFALRIELFGEKL
jgi:hypothetical protein